MDPLHKHHPRFEKKADKPSNSYQYPSPPQKKIGIPFKTVSLVVGDTSLERAKILPTHGIEVVDVVVEPGGFPLLEFGSFHDSPVGGE